MKVLHQGTFESLVEAALGAGQRLEHRGRYYERIAGGRAVAIYRRAPHGLEWIQERVEDYEFSLFHRLLTGHCGDDGMIRRHACLIRGRNGTYRPVPSDGSVYL